MLAPLRFLFIFLDSTGYTMGLGRVLGDMAMDLGLARPASRKQESEADYIGLMMMAQSCYNPQEAVKVWQRMEIAQKDQDMPEWLSTHPSVRSPGSDWSCWADLTQNSNRITQMQQWLPKAEAARSESECAVTLGYSEDFKAAFKDNSLLGMFRSQWGIPCCGSRSSDCTFHGKREEFGGRHDRRMEYLLGLLDTTQYHQNIMKSGWLGFHTQGYFYLCLLVASMPRSWYFD